MSFTVGKISGQMLENNLVRRDMQTGDENLAFETNLIYLDVFNKRVGINTDIPIRPLQINGVFDTTSLLVDTQTNFPNFIVSGNTISNPVGDIFLYATGPSPTVTAKTIHTDGLQFDTNRILSRRSNENIDIFPNVSGQIIANSNIEISGNLHATGNITFDGNLIFGNDNNDNVIFNSDIASDIFVDTDNFYDLGSNTSRWSVLNTDLINGVAYTAGSLTSPSGIDFGLRQGQIWYVSSNGSNSNVGDHPNGPFATIEYALTQATSGDTVYIYPGVYVELFPLIIPDGVTVKGSGIRDVTIIPDTASTHEDVFKLNGQTTVEDLTIADFYYDSYADKGYAFSFDTNFNVISRSPYVKNVSVITKGSVISGLDPLGFNQGDAGRGAKIDGFMALPASIEASMLFDSATFICPGADTIVMKNHVRVEWLNCFIYYANRGLYAENGNLGFAGLGSDFGVEVRSIGSANVYGNYGAYADGNEVLMYLINHNFGYIGSGLDSNNDPTDTVQANEVVTLNDSRIYYQSMDHKGDLRLGGSLRVNSYTGEVLVESPIISTADLTVSNGLNTSALANTAISVDNKIIILGNDIYSTVAEINLTAANNNISLNSNLNVAQNLNVTNTTINGNTILGNQNTDNLTLNSTLAQSLVPTYFGQFELGSNNFRFNQLSASAFIQDDIIIDSNVISTTVSNSNLELRANATGVVRIDSSLYVGQNITVSSLTSFSNVNTGTVTANNIIANNLVTIASTNTFDDIQFNGNRIGTIVSNADLEFAANGVGVIDALDTVLIDQDLTVFGTTSFQNIDINQTLTLDNINVLNNATVSELSTGDILIRDNFITTTLSNSNLEMRADGFNSGVILDQTLLFKTSTLSNILTSGTGVQRSIEFAPFAGQNFKINSTGALSVPIGNNSDRALASVGEVRLNNTSNRFEGRLSSGVRQLYGLYDLDQNTYISAELAPGVNDNIIRMYTDGVLTASFTEQAAQFQKITVDELAFNNNVISTVNSNSDIELVQSGSGVLKIKDDFEISNNLIKNITAGAITTISTTGGYVQFGGNAALGIPVGNTAQRLASPPIGASRYNTDSSELEVYDGTVWTSAAGTGGGISAGDMEELVNILTLVLA